tara:strand:+ start:453 stop:3371 length:2919 start_codon:yes stop_codon:yes gene_type:complete
MPHQGANDPQGHGNIQTRLGRIPQGSEVGKVDSRLRTKQLMLGLESISTQLKAFGKSTREREKQNDIITARTAFAVDKELPGGLRAEAEIAYNDLVAQKETAKFFRILHDDATVFGTGLLADDENYPDHTTKQAAYEDFVDGSIKTFFGNAQFNELQQTNVLDFVDQKRNAMKNAYTVANAKDIAAQKANDSAEYVAESITATFNAYKVGLDVPDIVTGKPLPMNSYFNETWHEDLKAAVMKANPHLLEDKADLLILQQLELAAIDPDNPQPEMLDYLDDKRKGGKPRYSSIQALTDKVKSIQKAARTALITNENSIIKREERILKRNEMLAEQGAMLEMIQNVDSDEGEKDLTKLESQLKTKYSHLKSSSLRAIITHAKALTEAGEKEGDPEAAATLKGKASRGELNIEDLANEPSSQNLNRTQYADVLKEVFNYGTGKVSQKRKKINDSVKYFMGVLQEHMGQRNKLKINGKWMKMKKFDVNLVSGKVIIPIPIQAQLDRIANKYEVQAEEILELAPPDDSAGDFNVKLTQLQHNMFKAMGVLQGAKETIHELGELSPEDQKKAEGKIPEVGVNPTFNPENNIKPKPSALVKELQTDFKKSVNTLKKITEKKPEEVKAKKQITNEIETLQTKVNDPNLTRAEQKKTAFSLVEAQQDPEGKKALARIKEAKRLEAIKAYNKKTGKKRDTRTVGEGISDLWKSITDSSKSDGTDTISKGKRIIAEQVKKEKATIPTKVRKPPVALDVPKAPDLIQQSGIDSSGRHPWLTSGDPKLLARLNQKGSVPQKEFLEILAEEYSKTDFHSTAEIYKAAQSLDIIDDLSKEQLAILNVFKNELASRGDFKFVDWKHSDQKKMVEQSHKPRKAPINTVVAEEANLKNKKGKSPEDKSGMYPGPKKRSVEDAPEPVYTTEDMFNSSLSADELKDEKVWPSDFLVKKLFELQDRRSNLDEDEKEVLQRIREELTRRGVAKG